MTAPNRTLPATGADIDKLASLTAAANFPWWMIPELFGQAMDPFTYTLDVLDLAANGTETGKVTVESDSAFYLVAQSIVATEADDASTIVVNPPLLVTLRDAGAGRLLSSEAVHAGNYFGTAQLPYTFPIPRMWAPASSILVPIQNLGADALDVRIAFHGIKVYNFTKLTAGRY